MNPVDGILLLDKPVGLSSNSALQKVKKLFQAQKAGHTGSLDPLASGLLPICFGEATKFSQYLLDSDKTYEVCAKLGERTTTSDSEGEVVETGDVEGISNTQVETVVATFKGQQQQVPSMFSALKFQGQPLYKLARKGITVERKPRDITIHELEILSFQAPLLRMRVRCTKGTYIRTLVDDIGQALGCGAHVAELRRLEAGPFVAAEMLTLDMLREEAETSQSSLYRHLKPVDAALGTMPDVSLTRKHAVSVRHGQAVRLFDAPAEGWVRLVLDKRFFIGVGEILKDGRIAPRRLVSKLPITRREPLF